MIRDEYHMAVELQPPGYHRQNTAKVVIQNLKAQFLRVLAGVADNFLMQLWDWLLTQTKIILNLLHQSNIAQHTLTLVAPLIITRCHWHQWDTALRSTRKKTREGCVPTIQWIDGSCLHHQSSTIHICAT